ncbi:hypothetical protein ACFL5V_09195 [Fibrobacterota bacterium]
MPQRLSQKTGHERSCAYPVLRRSMYMFLLVLMATGSGFAEKITVEGVGYDEKSALRNALRNAVEQGVAAHLKEKGVAENRDKVNKKILNQTKGYVKNHFVVSTEKEFGLVKLKVAAEVEMGKLEDDLIAQKLLYEIKNKPRIMIILDERAAGEEMFEKTATHKFEEYLLEKGFKIVEPEQLKKVQEMEKARAMNDGDLASMGFRMGADLIIRGGVSAGKPTPKKIYGKQFYTVPVQLNAHVVRTDNADIVASKTKRVKKNSQEEFSAAQFGLEVGGKALAENLIKDLMKYWRSEAYKEANVELMVTGAGNRGVSKIQKLLEGVGFIKDVRLRYFETRSALFDISLKGTVQDLRELFTDKSEFNLTVTHITSNRIGAKSGKQAAEISFEFAEEPGLDIMNFSIREIFPSKVRYYEQNPLATVKLKCLAGNPVSDIKVAVNIPAIMDLPANSTHKKINPGEEAEVELKLILNSDKVLQIHETKSISGEVTLTYIQNGKKQSRKLTAPVQVYDRNAMDWADPMSLAAFVTYREPSIHKFARQAVLAVEDKEGMNTAMVNGMSIFQALNKRGIKYVKDPAGAPGNRTLDRVQFPMETMASQSGDCDDTSVLYAAMLTAVGVESAIVSYPDHVLVMFNTEVFEKNRFALSADGNRIISHRGTLWIPVETTLIGKGFLDAWSTAAEEFHQAVSDGQRIEVIELNEAWKTYAAVSIKSPAREWKVQDLKTAVAGEHKKVKADVHASWKKAITSLEEKGKKGPEEQNRLGILYARSGDYKKAADILKNLYRKKTDPRVMNNYACAVILSGDETKALQILNKAFKKDKLPGVAVNRALSYYLKAQSDNDMEGFVSALKEANDILPDGVSLDKYLGFALTEEGDTRAAGDHEQSGKQKLDRRRLKELIKKKVLSKDFKKAGKTSKEGTAKLVHFGGVRGADPEQVAQIVDLLYWFEI